MRLSTVVLVAATATLLAGCQNTNFEQAKAELKASPALRLDEIARCSEIYNHRSAEDKAKLAKALRVSPNTVVRTICTRFANGLASGKFTEEDMRTMSPRFIRVIQGR